MPVTPWQDVAGIMCELCCWRVATHIYGWTYICCDCHAGPGNGLINDIEARAAHEEVLFAGLLTEGNESGSLDQSSVRR